MWGWKEIDPKPHKRYSQEKKDFGLKLDKIIKLAMLILNK